MTLDEDPVRCIECGVINARRVCNHCYPLSLDEAARLAEAVVADRNESHAFALETGNYYHDADRGTLARAVLAMLPVVRAAERAVANVDPDRCAIWMDSSAGEALSRAISKLHTPKGRR